MLFFFFFLTYHTSVALTRRNILCPRFLSDMPPERTQGFHFETLHESFPSRHIEFLSLVAYQKKKKNAHFIVYFVLRTQLSVPIFSVGLGACASSQDTWRELCTDSLYHRSVFIIMQLSPGLNCFCFSVFFLRQTHTANYNSCHL